MTSFFTALMLIAMLAVLGALGTGIFAMIRGGEFNRKYGNRLMQLRVMFQGLALACLALAWMASGK